MTISSQTICFEARCKCGVGFIHTQLASSYANAPQQLASSRSTVGFITRDFHALISRQHSQTNRHGLYTLFLTSKSRCMHKINSEDALLTTQNVLSRSGRFGVGHTGWSQLQLASSVSPLWIIIRTADSDDIRHDPFVKIKPDWFSVLCVYMINWHIYGGSDASNVERLIKVRPITVIWLLITPTQHCNEINGTWESIVTCSMSLSYNDKDKKKHKSAKVII